MAIVVIVYIVNNIMYNSANNTADLFEGFALLGHPASASAPLMDIESKSRLGHSFRCAANRQTHR